MIAFNLEDFNSPYGKGSDIHVNAASRKHNVIYSIVHHATSRT